MAASRVTFGDTVSLRADRHTRLRFDGRERITLFEGALYVDSGGVNAVPALRIGTPAGEVRHVGTQFQVSVSGETTQVRVREGRVLLTHAAGAQADIVTGDEVKVRGEDLEWRHALPSFGPDWEWSASIAPPLPIESRPLSEFLSWTWSTGPSMWPGSSPPDPTIHRRLPSASCGHPTDPAGAGI